MVRIYEKAPDFTAPAATGKGELVEISLSALRGRWVVLFFYPLDFTFVCPTEIQEFSRRVREFDALGARVIGCSVDSVYSHKAWIEHGLGEIAIPLVADITKRIARDYGALLEDKGIATRATFVIDPDGVVQHATINNLGVGRSVDETLRVLQAFGKRQPLLLHPRQDVVAGAVEDAVQSRYAVGDEPLGDRGHDRDAAPTGNTRRHPPCSGTRSSATRG